jgi:hypothetical protein
MARAQFPYLFAVYSNLDDLIDGVRALKRVGQQQFQVFSPVPHHDIERLLERKPSPVKVFTLVGGLFGLVIGWAITIGPLPDFNLHVGGKPIVSVPPFGVVAYISTILFGALATVVGLILNARLPQVSLVTGYDERISSSHFGIQVYCAGDAVEGLTNLLKSGGALDVTHVTGR